MRVVKRVVDDTTRNQRVLLHLACGHTRILDQRDLETVAPGWLMTAMQIGAEISCEQCPDLPPPPPTDASEVQQRLDDFQSWIEPRKVTS